MAVADLVELPSSGLKVAWDVSLEFTLNIGDVDPITIDDPYASMMYGIRRDGRNLYRLVVFLVNMDQPAGTALQYYNLDKNQVTAFGAKSYVGVTLVALVGAGTFQYAWLQTRGPINVEHDVTGVPAVGNAVTYNGTTGFKVRAAVTEPMHGIVYDITPGAMKVILTGFG